MNTDMGSILEAQIERERLARLRESICRGLGLHADATDEQILERAEFVAADRVGRMRQTHPCKFEDHCWRIPETEQNPWCPQCQAVQRLHRHERSRRAALRAQVTRYQITRQIRRLVTATGVRG